MEFERIGWFQRIVIYMLFSWIIGYWEKGGSDRKYGRVERFIGIRFCDFKGLDFLFKEKEVIKSF